MAFLIALLNPLVIESYRASIIARPAAEKFDTRAFTSEAIPFTAFTTCEPAVLVELMILFQRVFQSFNKFRTADFIELNLLCMLESMEERLLLMLLAAVFVADTKLFQCVFHALSIEAAADFMELNFEVT